MISAFLIVPLLTALVAAVLAGALGCAVVWRRMAYLGDTIAHGALLGVAFALLTNISIPLGIVLSSLAIALLFSSAEKRAELQADTTLGILSHGSLAMALVAIALSGKTVDINALLFGDVLASSTQDMLTLLALLAVVAITALIRWNTLMRVLIHEDMATVEGIPTAHIRTLLTVVLALTVALSIKVTGVLLITALLIIPAASARLLTRTPTHMAMLACVLAVASVGVGFAASLTYDTPLSPTIIVGGLGLLLVCGLLQRLRA